ncbi:MAG TPA: alpha/beta hydrolase [Bacteroidales bacterium]|nr:alpha/beta hydrolase [Bacteroidales bacterium]
MNTPPEILSVPAHGVTLKVTRYPNPGKENIILLHGGPGVPDEMTELAGWLSRHFQVINFEQRGIGTDLKEIGYRMEDYIADINHLADYFRMAKFHLFGHSWGGLYAQLYASRYPEKLLSLFLCSPASGTGSQWEETEKEIFRYNYNRSTLWEWLGMAVNTVLGYMGNKSAYSRLFRQIIINYHKGYNVEPPDEEKLKKITPVSGFNTRKEIRKAKPLPDRINLSCPVIITFGESDAYGNSKHYVLHRFPYATTSVIPHCGHTPWKHNPGGFQKVLSAFYLSAT